MNVLHSLTVRGKLVAAFSFVLALMALLGGFAWLQMSRINAQTEQILTYRLAGIRDSGRMVAAATRLRTREYRVAVSKPEDVAASIGRYRQAVEAFDKAGKDYAGFLFDAEEKKLFSAAIDGWNTYMQLSAKVVTAAQAGSMEESLSMVLGASKNFDTAMEGINALLLYNDEHARSDAAAARALHRDGGLYVIAMVLAASGLAMGLGFLIARSITRPLNEAVVLAEAVAAGDLTCDVEVRGRDEIAALSHALRRMVARLRSVVGDVRQGVESVTTASTEISMGNADLSQRTEEQAANLQQTAASMEQLTSTVRQNADNARAAAQLAQGARDVATRGGEVVGRVVTTMGEISGSSKRIADIISVIDGIAFQTNILALNAAVEAARAGEQGRGFAVVAAEVRSLAQRSAGAAKEIKSLIEQSVEKVADGSRLVSEAGETMSGIVSQVQRVNDLVGEISSASLEQTQGIEQVGDAVAQLDQVTQQNAALVEESAAAAESMKHQAERLAQTVAIFRTTASAARAAAPARPVASAGPDAPVVPNRKPQPSTAAAADGWTSF